MMRLTCGGAAFALLAAVAPVRLWAADNHYIGGAGNWGDPNNWSLGLPSLSDTNTDVDPSIPGTAVTIDVTTTDLGQNSLTVNNLNILYASQVYVVPDASPNVPLTIQNQLTVDQDALMFMQGGAVSAASADFGAYANGNGILEAGAFSVSDDLHLGRYGGGSGFFTQGGGTLSVGLAEYVGPAFSTVNATGNFQQSGGTHTVGNGLQVGNQSVGSGAYGMSGGTLSVTNGIFVGQVGAFTQTGGTVSTVNGGGYGDLTVDGSYELDNTNLSDPAVLQVANNEYIGDYGTGSFLQTGGTNTANGIIYIDPSGLQTGSVYDLQGGTLSATQIVNGGLLKIHGGATLNATITGNGTVEYTGNANLAGGTISQPLVVDANTTVTKTTAATETISGTQTYGVNTTYEADLGTTIFTTPIGTAGSANLVIHANTTKIIFNLGSFGGSHVEWAAGLAANTPRSLGKNA
jgi:hypothetical protein